MRTGKVLALLFVGLAGCDLTNLDVYRCLDPNKGHKDSNGEPDPCHRNDLAADAGAPGDAGETCAGVCLPQPPAAWDGPMLVWTGDEAAAPPCPASASTESFAAHRPPAGQPCAATCACAPPSGSCALPATLTTSAATCAGDSLSVPHTPFDPPVKWQGDCTTANAIPAGQLCGGVPCVQSVTIAPLTMKESDCLPIEQPNVPLPPWGTFARGCFVQRSPPLCNTNGACVPAAPGPEFKQCLAAIDDHGARLCPPNYPDKSIFYENFVDERVCTPCTCGAPENGTCTGSIGLFSDAVCAAPLVGPTLSIDAKGPKCYDVPQGSKLGSKSASEPTYKSGTCPATGGQLGRIAAQTTWVICCQGTP
jgi:hypothetical protein